MKLTSKRRKALPRSAFALPERDGYPIPDVRHAILAKGRATLMRDLGYLTAAEKKRVDARADRVIRKAEKKYARFVERRERARHRSR